ncbi:MAG: hypothetical protein J6P14_03455 [Ruminococcus sp.]|nr:hypothetical protein [Ruminococcus sp.]
MEKKHILTAVTAVMLLAGCSQADNTEVNAPTEPVTTESASSGNAAVSASTSAATSENTSRATSSSTSSGPSDAKTSGQSSHKPSSDGASEQSSKRTGNAPAQPASAPASTTTVAADVNSNRQQEAAFKDGSFTFKVIDDGLEVTENGQKLQTIAVNTEEMQRYLESNTSDNLAEMSVSDFDSDGNNDLFIPQQIGVLNTFGVYYHFDPMSGEYEKWDQMKEIDTFAVVNSEDNTFVTNVRYSEDESESCTYGWDDDGAPVLKTMEKQYKSSGDTADIFVDYTDYTSGSEVLVKRERLLFDDEHNVAGSEEVEIN